MFRITNGGRRSGSRVSNISPFFSPTSYSPCPMLWIKLCAHPLKKVDMLEL